MTRTAFKLLRVRRDKSIGPLFIGRSIAINEGVWYDSKPIHQKGYQFRPGWHVAPYPFAPHLSIKGRVWCKVEVSGVEVLTRPLCQGGIWGLCERMRVIRQLTPQEHLNTVNYGDHATGAVLEAAYTDTAQYWDTL